MTAILSALLFAASLSSTDVGEFFTLPLWMSPEVSSYNTPGSDPADTNGWYVAEYTNGVNETHWTVTGDGLSISNQTIHYVNDELGFNVTQVAIRYAELKYPGYTEYWPVLTHVVGDRSTLCLSWDGAVYAFKDGTYHLLRSSLTATRESATQVPTGRFVPRAARMTPEVQAGILSSFAGYFERQYYSSQGQSNVWDTSIYGPMNNKNQFWFDPLNQDFEFVYSPTNRTITSMRLLEYDNICNLAYHMISYMGQHDFCMFGCSRPGWIDIGNFYYPQSFWSTTDNKYFDGTEIVPSFSWISNPTVSSLWRKCSQTFGCLYNDSVWRCGHYPGNNFYNPSEMMMEKLSFDQPTYVSWLCSPGQINHTIKELIETNFPHADGWAITNNTRRLMSDRLCCVNQMLSLMDRTYNVPDVVYPTKGTNTLYNNIFLCNGEIDVEATWNEDHYDLTPKESHYFTWESHSCESHQIESSCSSSGSAISRVVTGTGTGASVTFGLSSITNSFYPDYGIENELLAEATGAGLSLNDGDFISVALEFKSMSRAGAVIGFWVNNWSSPTYDYYEGTILFPLDIDDASINAYFSYVRSYNYARTIGQVGLGVTQPGFESEDVFSSAKVGSVLGVHYKSGITSISLTPIMVYDRSKSTIVYNSNESSYQNSDSLLLAVRSDASEEYNKFVSIYGKNPDDYDSIIPINATDADRVKSSVKMERANIEFEEIYVNVAYGYYQTDGESEYIAGCLYESWYHLGGDYEEFWRNLFYPVLKNVVYSKDSPSQREIQGLRFDSKVGAITRTDWEWKTLKRDSEED